MIWHTDASEEQTKSCSLFSYYKLFLKSEVVEAAVFEIKF